jgi:hypothetical protein
MAGVLNFMPRPWPAWRGTQFQWSVQQVGVAAWPRQQDRVIGSREPVGLVWFSRVLKDLVVHRTWWSLNSGWAGWYDGSVLLRGLVCSPLPPLAGVELAV